MKKLLSIILMWFLDNINNIIPRHLFSPEICLLMNIKNSRPLYFTDDKGFNPNNVTLLITKNNRQYHANANLIRHRQNQHA